MSRRDWVGTRLAAIAALVLLSGCGSSDPGVAAGTAAPKPGNAGPRHRSDMVAAVSASKAPGPIDLQFAIPHRPVIGEALDISLSLVPSVDLDRLLVRFQASEGLDVTAGAEISVEKPPRGAEITHTLTILPKSDGIFSITAVVLTDSDTESVARTFSIPVITGTGLTPEPPSSPSTGAPASPARP